MGEAVVLVVSARDAVDEKVAATVLARMAAMEGLAGDETAVEFIQSQIDTYETQSIPQVDRR